MGWRDRLFPRYEPSAEAIAAHEQAERQRQAPQAPSHTRPLTVVIIIFNVLMLIWLVAGVGSAGQSCQSETYVEACQTGAAIGGAAIVFLWALGDIILGVIWLVTRKPQRTCPVCGSNLAVGLTVCPTCGHDFRTAATPNP